MLRALLGLQKEKAQLNKATWPSARGNSYFLMEAILVLEASVDDDDDDDG